MQTLPLAWLDASWFDWIEVALVPVVLAYLAVMIHRFEARDGQRHWINQKVIERRIEIFAQMGPIANDLFCFFTWRGRWKEIDPEQAVAMKRDMDRLFYVNRYIFSEDFYMKYAEFTDACFATYQSANTDAKLRTHINSSNGNRKRYFGDKWKESWDDCFTHDDPWESAQRVDRAYANLMIAFREELDTEQRI